MSPFKIIIVGGGLGGSLLANGLVNNDVDVTVYERDGQQTKREGYQVRLGKYGLSGFRACLDSKQIALIEEKFGSSAVNNRRSPYTAPSIYSTKFRPILDLGKLPGYNVSTSINRVVLRDFLLKPLNEKRKIRFNKSFSRYEIIRDETDSEKVRVHFEDGTCETCDVLVGADGSGSKVLQLPGLIVEITNLELSRSIVSLGSTI
jgi:2-polyprenyl-6-methoxyphenol hydroxylase-like FAD-dependent oxidoreductase